MKDFTGFDSPLKGLKKSANLNTSNNEVVTKIAQEGEKLPLANMGLWASMQYSGLNSDFATCAA